MPTLNSISVSHSRSRASRPRSSSAPFRPCEPRWRPRSRPAGPSRLPSSSVWSSWAWWSSLASPSCAVDVRSAAVARYGHFHGYSRHRMVPPLPVAGIPRELRKAPRIAVPAGIPENRGRVRRGANGKILSGSFIPEVNAFYVTTEQEKKTQDQPITIADFKVSCNLREGCTSTPCARRWLLVSRASPSSMRAPTGPRVRHPVHHERLPRAADLRVRPDQDLPGRHPRHGAAGEEELPRLHDRKRAADERDRRCTLTSQPQGPSTIARPFIVLFRARSGSRSKTTSKLSTWQSTRSTGIAVSGFRGKCPPRTRTWKRCTRLWCSPRGPTDMQKSPAHRSRGAIGRRIDIDARLNSL